MLQLSRMRRLLLNDLETSVELRAESEAVREKFAAHAGPCRCYYTHFGLAGVRHLACCILAGAFSPQNAPCHSVHNGDDDDNVAPVLLRNVECQAST
jgi:hypothetical protein